MERFKQLLARLATEHEQLRQECERLRADAEAWRSERPSCHKAVAPSEMNADDINAYWSSMGGIGPDASPARDHSTNSIDGGGISVPPCDSDSSLRAPRHLKKKVSESSTAIDLSSREGSRAAASRKGSRSSHCVDDPEKGDVRKPSLTFSNQSSGKKRCPSKGSLLKGRGPECKLWPVWLSQEGDEGGEADGVEAIKMLCDTSKSESRLVRKQQSMVMRSSKSCLRSLVMSPSSSPRIFWDVLSVLVLSYDILSVPVMCFVLEDGLDGGKVMHIATTTFWTVDILFSFFSSVYSNGMLEMRPRMIAARYLRGWFLLDFPVVVMDWCASALLSGHVSQAIGVLRINKVVRFVRIMRVVRLLRLVKLPGWAESIADTLRSESLVTSLGILRSLLIISVASHYLACIWYYIGWLQRDCITWLNVLQEEERDIAYFYITALHWSLTQFTPASMEVVPRNTPERVFAVIVILSAMVAFSCFVSSITQAMGSLQRLHAERDRQRGAMRRFLEENRISLKLGGQITKIARNQNMVGRLRVMERDVQAFQLLPESLRQELHWEVYASLLSLHPLFQSTMDLDDGFVQEVCHTAMSEVALARYEELFSPGQQASHVYFTRSGTWEYRRHWEDVEPMEITGERCMCEVSLWLQWEIQGVLNAVTTCEAASLNASKFHQIVSCRPALLMALRVYASGYKAHLMCEGIGALADVEFLPEMLQRIVDDAMQAAADPYSSETSKNAGSKSMGMGSAMLRMFSGRSRGNGAFASPAPRFVRRTERL